MEDPAAFERTSLLAAQSRILDDGSGNVDKSKLPEVLAYARVPERLLDVDRLHPKLRPAAIVNKDSIGVRITGPARSGKSLAAASFLRWAAQRGFTIAWRTADELTEANYETVRGNEADKAEASQERWFLSTVVEVLVIDNLDVLVLTDFSARHVLSIVRARADNGLFTVVTSPLMPDVTAKNFLTAATLPAISLQTYMQEAMTPVQLERRAVS